MGTGEEIVRFARNLNGNSVLREVFRDLSVDILSPDSSILPGIAVNILTRKDQLLKDYFGDQKLQQIKALQINAFFDYMSQVSYSRSYITKCRAMLIQIFDAAGANELTTANPARKSRIRRNPEVSNEEDANTKDAFTEEELSQLRHKLRDNLLGNSILLMIGTGLRAQEILALTPEDIAADGSSVTVRQAIKMVDGIPTLGPPKSIRGHRTVPVPLDYRKHAIFLRYYGGKEHVWTSGRKSGLFDVGVFRKQYYRELKEIPGVRLLPPHCCRPIFRRYPRPPYLHRHRRKRPNLCPLPPRGSGRFSLRITVKQTI